MANDSQLSMRVRLPKRPTISRELRSICIGSEDISYTLQRSTRRRRTIQIQLDPEDGIKVLVPHTLTDAEVEDFLLKRSDWILKHRMITRDAQKIRDWANSNTTKLRGKILDLIVTERGLEDPMRDAPPSATKSLEGDRVVVTIPPSMDPERKSEVLLDLERRWYREEAFDHFKTRIEALGNLMEVKPRHLKISEAKKRWGSCSGKGSINLNRRLIELEDSLIDYVVVHELAHLIELNHSPRFWSIVERMLPDYRELRRKLREHSPSSLS